MTLQSQSSDNNVSAAVLIRPVELEDAADLKHMCWPDRSFDHIVDLIRRTQKLAQNRRGLGVVAVQDGTACAFGLLTLWTRAAEISDLIVNDQHRSQGIGSLIITSLTTTARDLQVQVLEIGVALSNPRALSLYRRLGFVDGRVIEIDLGQGPEQVMYLYKHLD